MSNTKTIRGAHSGFMRDGYCHTDSAVSCGRVMRLRVESVEERHDAATLARFEIGKNNEYFFLQTLTEEYQHDVEIITGDFEGHADVVTDKCVYELKSVTSKNVWKKVQQGKYKLSNLAQLVGYMITLNRPAGILVYTLYEDENPISSVEFNITIVNEQIFVNNKFIRYSVPDWRAHQLYLKNQLDSEYLDPDRPMNPDDSFFTPCTWCKWNSVCDTFNAFEETADTFIERCRSLLEKEST